MEIVSITLNLGDNVQFLREETNVPPCLTILFYQTLCIEEDMATV